MRALAELIRALAAFLYPPGPEHVRLAGILGLPEPPTAAEHSDTLLLQVHPYASVYLSIDGMKGGEVRDRTDGFWRAVGREPPVESDHLGALLGLLAALLEDGDASEGQEGARERLTGHATGALRREFLDGWVGVFLDAVDRSTSTAFHRSWSHLLRQALLETETDGARPHHPVVSDDPNRAPVRSPEEHGLMVFIGDLLAPARSGIVVTRRELERVARGAGLAFRAGPRVSMLETLLRQAPGETLEWLERATSEWSALHAARGDDTWTERASDTRELARGLAGTLDALSSAR